MQLKQNMYLIIGYTDGVNSVKYNAILGQECANKVIYNNKPFLLK